MVLLCWKIWWAAHKICWENFTCPLVEMKLWILKKDWKKLYRGTWLKYRIMVYHFVFCLIMNTTKTSLAHSSIGGNQLSSSFNGILYRLVPEDVLNWMQAIIIQKIFSVIKRQSEKENRFIPEVHILGKMDILGMETTSKLMQNI